MQMRKIKNSSGMDNKSYDNVQFDGRTYPRRLIFWENHYYLIGNHSLNKILSDNEGAYISETARIIDETIFFFVDDNHIHLPDNDIIKILTKNI